MIDGFLSSKEHGLCQTGAIDAFCFVNRIIRDSSHVYLLANFKAKFIFSFVYPSEFMLRMECIQHAFGPLTFR